MFRFIYEIFFVLGKNKRKLPMLMMLLLAGTVIDLIGLGLIAPFIGLVVDPEIVLGPNKSLLDFLGLPTEQKPLLIILGIGLSSVFLIKVFSIVLINYKIIRFCQDQCVYLRSLMMKTFQSIPYNDYLNRNSSEYVHVVQTLSGQFSKGVVMSLLRLVSESIVSLSIVCILVWTHAASIAVLVLLIGVMIYSYDKLFRSKMKLYGGEINKFGIFTTGATYEGMGGFKEIRILGKEDFFHERVKSGAKKQAFFETKNEVLSIAPKYIMEFLIVCFFSSLVIGFIVFEQNLKSILPTLGIFGVASLRLMPSANIFSSCLSRLRISYDSVNRLFKDLKSFENIKSKNFIKKISSSEETFQELNLSEISFRYPGSKEDNLKQISLTITQGESIGLIGPSGSGKTTLVDLILGLLEPKNGIIKYNGQDFSKSLNRWRSQVAYLPQQVFLLDSTLKQNICIETEEGHFEENRLYDALKQARLTELVRQLPNGLETRIGDRGIRLSGGQRQRVALARSFYHDRNVLIMDESTSSLDYQTEKEIVEEIKNLKGKKTLIVIAHRLTTVEDCSYIYHLENGKFISHGSTEKILKIPRKSTIKR